MRKIDEFIKQWGSQKYLVNGHHIVLPFFASCQAEIYTVTLSMALHMIYGCSKSICYYIL